MGAPRDRRFPLFAQNAALLGSGPCRGLPALDRRIGRAGGYAAPGRLHRRFIAPCLATGTMKGRGTQRPPLARAGDIGLGPRGGGPAVGSWPRRARDGSPGAPSDGGGVPSERVVVSCPAARGPEVAGVCGRRQPATRAARRRAPTRAARVGRGLPSGPSGKPWTGSPLSSLRGERPRTPTFHEVG